MPSNAKPNESILRGNIEWHIELIAVQIRHAEKVKGRARSGYYKLATLLVASIVEAVVHALLIRKLGIDGVISTGDYETYECSLLPKTFCPQEDLVICKRRSENIQMRKNPDFAVLNRACLKEKLLSEKLFKKVESVRKIRNKIHIQGLDYIDRSYTKNNLVKLADVMNSLLSLYYVS